VAASVASEALMMQRETRDPMAAARRVYGRWGRHPAVYSAASWVVFLGREHELRQRAVEVMGLDAGARVLDVGCGTGRNFVHILRTIGPTGELVGFDQSPQMLDSARELARRNGWNNVRLVRGDAAVLAVGDPSFDGVISTLAMSVVPNYRAAVARCHAVLRKGGVLSICDAGEFRGRWAVLNPAVRALFVSTTAWNPDHDLVRAMREKFGDVRVEQFNKGSMYIASATKAGG
jgi:SAM-dependent methyltransferase